MVHTLEADGALHDRKFIVRVVNENVGATVRVHCGLDNINFLRLRDGKSNNFRFGAVSEARCHNQCISVDILPIPVGVYERSASNNRRIGWSRKRLSRGIINNWPR